MAFGNEQDSVHKGSLYENVSELACQNKSVSEKATFRFQRIYFSPMKLHRDLCVESLNVAQGMKTLRK